MRFRTDILDLSLLIQILTTLTANHTLVMTELSKEKLRFIISPLDNDDTAVYVNIPIESIFSRYKIESKANNHIPFFIDSSVLLRVLQACALNAGTTTFRLTKKQRRAYLNVEHLHNTQTILSCDVPIAVSTIDRVRDNDEPTLPSPAVKFKMPHLKHLANVIDKMSKISKRVNIKVNTAGELSLISEIDENPNGSITTYFKDLKLPSSLDTPTPRSSSQSDVSVADAEGVILLKHFSKLLSYKNIIYGMTIGAIVKEGVNGILVVHTTIGENRGTVTQYIPLLPAFSHSD